MNTFIHKLRFRYILAIGFLLGLISAYVLFQIWIQSLTCYHTFSGNYCRVGP
jgi:hypothetical protein